MRIFSFIVVLCAVIPAFADDSSRSGGVVIAGTRTRTDSTSYDSITLDEKSKHLYTLADILEQRVGVQVRRLGTSGSYSTVSIRGSNPNQVAVFLDGVPLSDSVYGEVNLESVPIDSIEKIEIYRGSAPIRFGTGNVGGVINLVTKKGKGFTETRSAVSYGSFGTMDLSLSHIQAFENSSLFLSGFAGKSSGNFTFTNDNATKTNTADDFRDTRRNNSNRKGGLTARWSYDLGNSELVLQNDFFAKDQGLPDITNTVAHASLSTVRNIVDARVRLHSDGDIPAEAEAGCFVNYRMTGFRDPYNEINFDTQRSDGRYLCVGGSLLSSVSIDELFQKLTLSLSPQNERFRSTSRTLTQGALSSNQTRNMVQWGAEDEFSFFSRKFDVTLRYAGSYRHDRFSSDSVFTQSGNSERKDLTHDFAGGAIAYLWKNILFVKGNISTRHRIPVFSELFGDTGYIVGNPSLRDERSLNYDAGAGITSFNFGDSGVLSCEYTWFVSDLSNGIILIQNSQKTMKSVNVSGARIYGHELAMTLSLFDHVEWTGNMTLQRAIDRSGISYYDGKYLPGRPGYEINGAVKVYSSLWSVTYSINATGANYRDRANSEPYYLDHRIYHSVVFQLFPCDGLTLSLEIRNITANQTWDTNGYPLPGRSFLGGISYIF